LRAGAEVSALSSEDGVEAGGLTFTEVDEDEPGAELSAGGFTLVVELLATGGGVVTTVVSLSLEADGAGVVVEVVVVRSHAASDKPSARAATRGISFMCSPYGSL
jgi:hypothetical protein